MAVGDVGGEEPEAPDVESQSQPSPSSINRPLGWFKTPVGVATAFLVGVSSLAVGVYSVSRSGDADAGSPASPAVQVESNEQSVEDSGDVAGGDLSDNSVVAGGDLSDNAVVAGGDVNVENLTVGATDDGSESSLSADEALEVVDVEYGTEPVEVDLDLDQLDRDVASGDGTALDVSDGNVTPTGSILPIFVNLRNDEDGAAIIKDVVAEVNSTVGISFCEPEAGGEYNPSFLYEMRFDGPGPVVHPKNFEVDANDSDQMALTLGPSRAAFLGVTASWVTLAGRTGDDTEHYFADVLDLDLGNSAFDASSAVEFLIGDPAFLDPTDLADVVACGADGAAELERLRADVMESPSAVVHPAFEELVAYYRLLSGLGS